MHEAILLHCRCSPGRAALLRTPTRPPVYPFPPRHSPVPRSSRLCPLLPAAPPSLLSFLASSANVPRPRAYAPVPIVEPPSPL
ncbi:MAG: hypothetical protein H0V70_18335 [Ktedonobacteraceae bacterium]|nr:hypothetical protein [Ktedonobacteraceae bacterium]